MPTIEKLSEEDLEALEQQGGLKERTLRQRKAAFDHFDAYIKQETGRSVKECLAKERLETEEGRKEFEKFYGRCMNIFS